MNSLVFFFFFLLVSVGGLASLEGLTAADSLGLLESFFVFTELRHAVECLNASGLHDCSENPGADTEADGGHVHAKSEWSGLEDATKDATIADHEELKVELAKEDNPVPEVAEGAQEDVKLTVSWLSVLVDAGVVSDLLGLTLEDDGHLVEDTAVDHVEHVHHDEDLEHESLVEQTVSGELFITDLVSEVGRVEVVWDLEHCRASVEHEQHDEELVEGLGEDGSHHWLGDDVVVGVDAVLANLGWVWVLSGESNSGKHVHDEVDPEELHHAEGRVTEDEGSGENEDHAADVDSHLELDELAHVVLNVTAVANRGNDSLEVVVHQDDIRVILGSSAAILSHGEANAGLAEGASIAETLTSDTNS